MIKLNKHGPLNVEFVVASAAATAWIGWNAYQASSIGWWALAIAGASWVLAEVALFKLLVQQS